MVSKHKVLKAVLGAHELYGSRRFYQFCEVEDAGVNVIQYLRWKIGTVCEGSSYWRLGNASGRCCELIDVKPSLLEHLCHWKWQLRRNTLWYGVLRRT